jgi:hypothetical protein
MVPLMSLWLPILLSAVIVFVASSVIHMMLSYHKSDFARVPDEDGVRAALREFSIPPGDYMVPCPADTKEMSSPEFIAKQNEGPVVWMTVLPNGPWNMGRSLTQWFLYSLVVSYIAAYVGSRAVGPGADYLDVFRFVGTTAFCCYSLALAQIAIWYARKWSSIFKSMFDGLVYALLTAGTFGWLWPG